MAKTNTVSAEISITQKLKQLYELQLIDSEVDSIQIVKGELPMVVSDLEDEIGGLSTRVHKLEGNIAEMDKDHNSHKINIKQSEDNIKKYEKQLDSVKNNREFDALNKEINLQRLEIQLSEKKMKEAKQIKSNQYKNSRGFARFDVILSIEKLMKNIRPVKLILTTKAIRES